MFTSTTQASVVILIIVLITVNCLNQEENYSLSSLIIFKLPQFITSLLSFKTTAQQLYLNTSTTLHLTDEMNYTVLELD